VGRAVGTSCRAVTWIPTFVAGPGRADALPEVTYAQ
jgi:hypothetical protein